MFFSVDDVFDLSDSKNKVFLKGLLFKRFWILEQEEIEVIPMKIRRERIQNLNVKFILNKYSL